MKTPLPYTRQYWMKLKSFRAEREYIIIHSFDQFWVLYMDGKIDHYTRKAESSFEKSTSIKV